MNRINALVIAKTGLALIGLSSIIIEVATSLERGRFNPANFFSYFTIQSNIIIIIALLVSAFMLYAGRTSKRLDYFRGAAAFYIAITGVVFSVLLSGLDPAALTAVPWDNFVLHYLIPVVGILDWIIDRPHTKLVFSKALLWIVYPIAYLAYSLIRGGLVNWYPYPFLDVSQHGYFSVLGMCAAIAIFGIVAIYGFTFQRKRK